MNSNEKFYETYGRNASFQQDQVKQDSGTHEQAPSTRPFADQLRKFSLIALSLVLIIGFLVIGSFFILAFIAISIIGIFVRLLFFRPGGSSDNFLTRR